jgi:hypothetical protein
MYNTGEGKWPHGSWMTVDWWSFFLVKSKTSGLVTTLLKCQIISISELLDGGLREFCSMCILFVLWKLLLVSVLGYVINIINYMWLLALAADMAA